MHGVGLVWSKDRYILYMEAAVITKVKRKEKQLSRDREHSPWQSVPNLQYTASKQKETQKSNPIKLV